MKCILIDVLEDWRKSYCQRCKKESDPIYRFCYDTSKEDLNGNPLEEFEIEVCKKCCPHLDRNWRSKKD